MYMLQGDSEGSIINRVTQWNLGEIIYTRFLYNHIKKVHFTCVCSVIAANVLMNKIYNEHFYLIYSLTILKHTDGIYPP